MLRRRSEIVRICIASWPFRNSFCIVSFWTHFGVRIFTVGSTSSWELFILGLKSSEFIYYIRICVSSMFSAIRYLAVYIVFIRFWLVVYGVPAKYVGYLKTEDTKYALRCRSTIWSAWFCHMSRDMTKPTQWVCAQRRLRSAWAWRKLGSLATH